VVILHTEARIVGVAWMVVGMAAYLLYRRSQGLDPWRPYRIERSRPPVEFRELGYRSALVPIFGTDVDGRALASAARLVGEDASVEALYVVTVPAQLSIDAGLGEEEAVGRSVLEVARLRAREGGIKLHTRLVRTRNPGATIVEEAKRQKAEIIYLATAHAPPSERALGPTATYLLAHRPARIVIETEPDGQGAARPTPAQPGASAPEGAPG
jgi:hypothetical protein